MSRTLGGGVVYRSRSMRESSRKAVRLGVRLTPPTAICVEYMQPGGPRISRRKLRTKVVRLHHPLASSSESCASRLAERFPRHFGEDVVNHAQLVRLISKIQRSANEGNSKTTFSAKETTVGGGGDHIHPDVAITTASTPNITAITNKKVLLLNDHETQLDGRNALSAGKTGCGVKVTETTTTSTSVSVECGRGSSLDYAQEDFNCVSESELSLAKQRMDVIFQRNSCRPGEAFYVHDIRKNFAEATEDYGWDDSSCSSTST